ncbi:MAG: radical SAM protein [Calditrichaeota bacterium]|nr:MAG: radical SAM protein [Calditrichota bacterium]
MIVQNFNFKSPDYSKILSKLQESKVQLNFKRNSISVSINIFTVLTFDLRGFLIYGIVDGITFKRGLGNRFLKLFRENGEKLRFDLTKSEKSNLLEFVKEVTNFAFKKPTETNNHESFTEIELKEFEQKIISKKISDYDSLQETYDAIYSPIMILPPDQYLALVVQMTIGCSYNKCSFCSFYKDVKFQLKPFEEVRNHTLALKNFLGNSIGLRKSIFLGDANSLLAPTPYLVKLLDFLNKEFKFDKKKFNGIYAFIDNFTQNLKTVEDYQELERRNFKRAYIGFETGSQNVLRLLNKPGTPQIAKDVVNRLKESGISVGVILMTGVGGKKYFSEHVEESAKVINEMNLDKNDIIYFSEFVSYGIQNYLDLLKEEKIEDNSPEDAKIQTEEIKSRLFPNWQEKPRMTKYEIKEFIY